MASKLVSGAKQVIAATVVQIPQRWFLGEERRLIPRQQALSEIGR